MRVIVAGLGAMGSSIAFHLSQRGVEVIGLDRFVPPHEKGSSHGESRIIREAYFEDPLYVPLVRRAGELWRELERRSGRMLLRRVGLLSLGPADSELQRGTLRSAREHAIPLERLEGEAIRRLHPFLAGGGDEVALLEPGAGVLSPESCIEAHLELAFEGGADLRTGAGVSGWRASESGVRVELEGGGHVEGDFLVLATGAWLPGLLPDLPLRVERQVMLWFAPRGDGAQPYPPGGPAFLWEEAGGVLHYGMPGLGGTLKVARHHGGQLGTLDELSREVSPADEETVRAFLERKIPGAAGRLLRGVVCRYTNTPGGRFLIDVLPGEPRVSVISACSGHGFKFASAVGEVVARRLCGEGDLMDLSSFRYSAALTSA